MIKCKPLCAIRVSNAMNLIIIGDRVPALSVDIPQGKYHHCLCTRYIL